MSRRFCFTINNFTPDDEQRLAALANNVRYIVYGRETGNSGTPHLQGFVIFNNSVSFNSAKSKIGDRAHLEKARGTTSQAADYCKKDGDFVEYGDIPSEQGKRSDWDVFKDWVRELKRVPSKRELASAYPALYARYHKRCFEIAAAIIPAPVLTTSEPRDGWQEDLSNILDGEPDPREIIFVVDPEGCNGKSWMCKYVLTKYPDDCQVLRIGKRDDLAFAVDETKRIFLFDIPRCQMEFLQYSVLESLKDQMLFSPKYESSFKTLSVVPHVVVFSNEAPDYTKLTEDRYNVINISTI